MELMVVQTLGVKIGYQRSGTIVFIQFTAVILISFYL